MPRVTFVREGFAASPGRFRSGEPGWGDSSGPRAWPSSV